MENPSLAKNLIYQRKVKGYSQEELAERASVTVRTIQRIENGEVNPHLQTIKLLAVGLNIEVDDLIILDDPKEETIMTKWLLLIHGTPIFGLVIPLCNILFPLFLWIHKREDNPIYEQHGRAVINFQITMTILALASLIALVTIEGYGFIFFIAVIPVTVLISIINLIVAINTHRCFYPAIPFLRKKTRTIPSQALKSVFLAMAIQIPLMLDAQAIIRLDQSVITPDSLRHKILQLVKDGKVTGMAVAVFNDGHAIFDEVYGYKNGELHLPLTDSTNIYGASLSKCVFTVLVMQLVEKGVIDLDVPLISYLPKPIYLYEPKTRWHDHFDDLREDTLYEKITARMCLDHTSGFPNWRWTEPDHKLRVKFQPGDHYSYSGEGMVFLQVILEKITGKGLEELARKYIFRPLRMDHSSYHWKPEFEKDFAFGHRSDGSTYPKDKDNEPRGPSTLETTFKDYILFLSAVLQGKLLKTDTWQEVFSPQIRIHSTNQFGPLADQPTSEYDSIQLSYALGWGWLRTPFGYGVFKEGHGDGFQHYSILFPQSKKGILIMTNSDHGESVFKELLEVALQDKYTPWKWESYLPYQMLQH
ncbi:MAG: serine hydrolase [Saprospiraceae bacterium]|nr:serine hydrolase [Saprospiraceae bacterium]